jgi:hypothetical protein
MNRVHRLMTCHQLGVGDGVGAGTADDPSEESEVNGHAADLAGGVRVPPA